MAVSAEELGFICREMREAKFVVGHDEMTRGELLVVRLSFSVDVSRAPATVNQFPFAVINFHRIPGVVRALGGDRCAGRCARKPEPFAMTTDHDAFETAFGG